MSHDPQKRTFNRFAEVFADESIVSTLWRQLSWSHFKEIIYQKDALQRDFYAEMCRVERWSVRTLRQKIDSMLYERTAISRKSEELIRHEIDSLRNADQLTPDLLFFNRKLKRLLAIDLKLGDFKPADKGQMELYLRWLDKYERQEEFQNRLEFPAGKKNDEPTR